MPKPENDSPKLLSENLFPVVGIGASAGGLEAFKKLIVAIPKDSGMAYILVQHLHPEHESALPAILQRITKLPVIEISDNVHVEPNNIYVIPTGKILVATDGILKLSPRSSNGKLNLPIDIFFSSLAEVHQSRAIGMVLSGNGADGTAGLKDIKAHGGLTIAQEPSTATYPGMPQHAIDANVVDFILFLEKIPARLMALQQSFKLTAGGNNDIEKDKAIENAFRQIYDVIKLMSGIDFSFYKQTTIRRCVIRRRDLLGLKTITEYADYLRERKPEQDILFKDLSIPVTSFFRDPEAFATLREKVLPEIVKNKSITHSLRIWVAGCSTGQKAYSLAICCQEFFAENDPGMKIQLFATDLSDIAIKKARKGLYSKEDIAGISEKRLQHFFDKTDGHYQVKKSVRDICIFAVHNFLKDTPFAKIDLISCRDVLIYLEPYLQKKALSCFHYALNDKGVLWLGNSETAGNTSELFIPAAGKDKFYGKKSIRGKFIQMISGGNDAISAGKKNLSINGEGKIEDYQKNANEILLAGYTPVGVIVNEQYEIVQFRGFTAEYLEAPSGKASLNLLKMAKEGMSFELRNALHKAKITKEAVIKEGIPINHGKKWVTIEVIPLLKVIDLHFLVLFRRQLSKESDRPAIAEIERSISVTIKKDKKDIHIQQLEKELAQAREDMRSITEDQEASNEELQSSNEELLSGSEELQSLNEELETSKEELQSTNEELITVNQELHDRNDELNLSRKFALAIISVLHEPLLVLDKHFIIKSANASFYNTFHLTEEVTIGKILFDLQDKGWEIPGLRKELEKIRNEKKIEAEIVFTFPSIGTRTICFNIQAINKEGGEQMVLLALDDITLRKNAEKILKENADIVLKEGQMLHNFLMDAPALCSILKGPENIYEFANTAYHEFTGIKDLIGKTMMEVMPELESQGYFKLLKGVYNTGRPFIGKEMPVFLKTGNIKTEHSFFNFNYHAINDKNGNTEGILVFAYNVTEQVLARQKLERNAEMIYNLYMNAPAFMCTLLGSEHTYDLVNPSYQKIFGNRKIVGKPILKALPELEGQGFDTILDNVYKTGETFVGIEVPIRLARDENLLPEECYFNFSYQPIYNEHKEITGILVFGYEVTEEIRGRKMQEESAARFRILADAMPQKMWTADATGNVNYLNQQWFDYTQKSFEELKGLGWEKIIHPDDWTNNKQTWLQSIQTGKDFELEHRFLRHDGIYHWHLSRGLAQKDIKGNVMVWIGTHTDIDEQVMKEHKKDEFISIASHEMKTPLTTAKAYLQLLELSLDETNEKAILYARKASLSVKRLNELITELLDVSKIQYGKLNYNISSFDFNQMIDNSVEDMQYSNPKHKIVKTGSIQQEITGDKNRLQQVVINLLSNAIKYSPESATVFVNVMEENNEIKVSVKDSGIGISKYNLEKIFDRYYRVEEHAIQFQGLGIGLYISYEIIKRHQGKLWAESELGKGSIFHFTLPFVNT